MEARNRKLQNLKLSDEFNKILNTWKNQFMDKLLGEVLGGPGMGTTLGGVGQEGAGGGTKEKSITKGGTGGDGQGKGGGEGDQKKKGQSHPVVLLSSYNPDPFGNGDTLHLSSRHYPVYQRPIDLEHGVYWMNTSRPLATAILEAAWRRVRPLAGISFSAFCRHHCNGSASYNGEEGYGLKFRPGGEQDQ